MIFLSTSCCASLSIAFLGLRESVWVKSRSIDAGMPIFIELNEKSEAEKFGMMPDGQER